MATTTVSELDWTVAELFERFGPIPIARICMDPAPGGGKVLPGFSVRVSELFETAD